MSTQVDTSSLPHNDWNGYPRPFDQVVQKAGCRIGVEIGVDRAEHAVHLLDFIRPERLYLVDPYNAYEDRNQDYLDCSRIVAEIATRHRRVLWCYNPSLDAASIIENELDFVYIDGSHYYASVMNDMIAWWPKIRPGGVMGGHDFDQEGAAVGLVKAVCEFADTAKFHLDYNCRDWWTFKR